MKQLIFTVLFFITSVSHAVDLPGDSIYNLNSEWTDQSGRKLHLSDLRGKPVVVSMVYMKCQYSCPMTVARMKEVEKALSEANKSKVQFLLVTFDIKHDTPDVMSKYAQKNHLDPKQWMFLTAKNETTVREFSTLIDFKYKGLPSGEFEHSYAIVALDADGRILGRTEGAEMNPKTIAELLNNK